MSLSITHLPTHWDTTDAYTVIAFLDVLRDQLWETYGEDITAMLQDASNAATTQIAIPRFTSSAYRSHPEPEHPWARLVACNPTTPRARNPRFCRGVPIT